MVWGIFTSQDVTRTCKKRNNFSFFSFRFGLVLWHINHCRLFNAKSSSGIYIKYIRFGLVVFYGISTTEGYLMPNTLYTGILDK